MTRLFCLLLGLAAASAAQDAMEHFERAVRPVLAKNCYGCHGPRQQMAGLRVDGRAFLMKGGKTGPAIAPGRPADSLIVKALRHEGLKMPMGGKLAETDIAAVEKWVREGAAWPQEAAAQAVEARHWAFEPVKAVAVPAGAANPVDAFLGAALQKAGLKTVPSAGREALIRRLSFILTGLPRAVEPERSYEATVDRLLNSPHFGERWARHWMDLVRFAETYGYEWNYETLGAWHYRDYLIRAFNRDVPVDQLIREHIAGDLLAKPRLNRELGLNESMIGTMFFRMGEMGHDDCVEFREIRTDVVDNQIDTLTKAFQGLTVSCARCHDHKMDPIPTADYYALYGVLTSARQVTRSVDLPEVHQGAAERLKALKPRIRRELARIWSAGSITPEQLAGVVNRDKPAKLEDPLYAWEKADWNGLGNQVRAEHQRRSAYNAEHFRPFGDFRAGGFAGWHADGAGLKDGATAAGEFAVAAEGEAAVTGVFASGVYTHALSDRLNGVLRSPFLPKDRKFVSLELMGGKLGARRTIVDNCMLGEDYTPIDAAAPRWFKSATLSKEKNLPVYLELATKFDNPRLPDRPDKLKNFKQEQLDSPGSFFGVRRVVLHDVDEAPRDDMAALLRLFEGSDPATAAEAAARYTAVLRAAAAAWGNGTAGDGDAFWLDWFARLGLAGNRADASPELAALIAEYRRIEATLPRPRVVNGMGDFGEGYDVPILQSGNPKAPGDVTPRHYLKIVTGGEPFRTIGSGREEVAGAIASARNPLTARVMVNRVWHHVFGRGIVASVDNFGRFGDAPSHPELLDYLADRFVKEGWSLKKLVRVLVTSEAFQRSSTPGAGAGTIDPQNRLLSHYQVRRLEAESIRDAILHASGRLDAKLFGPSVHPHRDDPKEYRKLISGALDGDGRRSIYLKVTRMEGSPFLELFDFPPPAQTRGARDVTNVPPQALGLLNDPFVVGEAGRWAEALLTDGAATPEARIDGMFERALQRSPAEEERQRFRGLAAELASLHQVPRERLMQSREVWKDVAHSILNLKEFLYVR